MNFANRHRQFWPIDQVKYLGVSAYELVYFYDLGERWGKRLADRIENGAVRFGLQRGSRDSDAEIRTRISDGLQIESLFRLSNSRCDPHWNRITDTFDAELTQVLATRLC